MFKEFSDFLKRGSLVDMAIGIAVGTAFATIAKSLVDDIVMPPVGLILGNVEFDNLFVLLRHGDPIGPYTTLAVAREAGAVAIAYGNFINNVLAFLVIAAVFFMILRSLNQLRREEQGTPAEPDTKTCPFCIHTIPLKASRCPQCTSSLA
ncbi:MAG TPA: large conductance mechanosensitive channel protein MscL [Longimicrobiales bacterium]|nr:large conductance mechanosensitive channel protein MscL [Longimicrobiales bacterium]